MNALNEGLRAPKYQQILEQMKGDILTGVYDRFLDREGCRCGDAAVRVVAFHVARRTFDQWLVIEHVRRLRAFLQRIDFGDDGDHRFTATPFGPDIGGHAGAATGASRPADSPLVERL